MRVWLDDQFNDPECPNRHPPDGFVGTDSIIRIASWLDKGLVDHVSFDHDLGRVLSGYTLARLIEKWSWERRIKPPTWDIHSANPVGRSNIEAAMKAAHRAHELVRDVEVQ